MKLCLVYITVSDKQEAIAIGRNLVKNRLVACANVKGPVTSIYRWEEEIKEEQEYLLIAKTQKKLVSKLTKRVESIHSYECPCVVVIPIEDGFAPFLQWIMLETNIS